VDCYKIIWENTCDLCACCLQTIKHKACLLLCYLESRDLVKKIYQRNSVIMSNCIGYYIRYEHSNKENESVSETDGKHVSLVSSSYLCTDTVVL